MENFVLCSFAHHVCGPLLQGGHSRRTMMQGGVATCHSASDAFFYGQKRNIWSVADASVSGKRKGGILVWLSLCSRMEDEEVAVLGCCR